MKKIILLGFMIFSLVASANLRCDLFKDGNVYRIEAQRPTFQGQRFVFTNIYADVDGNSRYLNFNTQIDPFGSRFNEFRLSAFGFELNVDIWPDRFPVVGRMYRAELRIDELGLNENFVNCRFDRFKK